MKNTFTISNQEERRIRNLHESYKDNHGTGKVIKEQSSILPGEWDPVKKALGLLTANDLTRVLKGCKVPVPPECKGEHILQNDDCLPHKVLIKYGACLSKAARQYKN